MTTQRICGDLADGVDPPPQQGDDHDDGTKPDEVAVDRRHRRPEVAQVGHEPVDAGGHDQRDEQDRGPDEQERHEPPGAVLEGLPQVDVGAAGARHRGAELGPDQAVASARSAPKTQPITACGPPKATTIAGMVMNGPMPHICDMLMAVASSDADPPPQVRVMLDRHDNLLVDDAQREPITRFRRPTHCGRSSALSVTSQAIDADGRGEHAARRRPRGSAAARRSSHVTRADEVMRRG